MKKPMRPMRGGIFRHVLDERARQFYNRDLAQRRAKETLAEEPTKRAAKRPKQKPAKRRTKQAKRRTKQAKRQPERSRETTGTTTRFYGADGRSIGSGSTPLSSSWPP